MVRAVAGETLLHEAVLPLRLDPRRAPHRRHAVLLDHSGQYFVNLDISFRHLLNFNFSRYYFIGLIADCDWKSSNSSRDFIAYFKM